MGKKKIILFLSPHSLQDGLAGSHAGAFCGIVYNSILDGLSCHHYYSTKEARNYCNGRCLEREYLVSVTVFLKENVMLSVFSVHIK